MGGSNPRKRIFVPQRVVSGGLDSKFETDPYDVELHGLMTAEQYKEAIEDLNHKLRRSRATKVDGALLATAPLLVLVPLVVWGARHRARTKRRKRLLKEAIDEFNMQYPALLMRWNRRPQSTLTIELREQSNRNQNVQTSFLGGEGQEQLHMIQATMVTPSIQQPQNQQSFPSPLTNDLLVL